MKTITSEQVAHIVSGQFLTKKVYGTNTSSYKTAIAPVNDAFTLATDYAIPEDVDILDRLNKLKAFW